MDDKKATKLIPVTVVSTTKESALVQWVEKGQTKRGYLPTAKLADKVDVDTLAMAAPYGVDFADYPLPTITSEMLAAALHEADIWTKEQLYANAPIVVGVLQRLYLLHLGSLVEFAAKQ